MDLKDLEPWECLEKQIIWKQLGNIKGKRILDFGSGFGITASYLASSNDVTAIEPSAGSVYNRWKDNDYRQFCGSTEQLLIIENESFDIIICHNVLEYASDREIIIKEFIRILKQDGYISIEKHNRPGRVMQMVVLLNNFKHANSLLDGNNGIASKYGEIHYYDDSDIVKWSDDVLQIKKTLGLRVFWDLQQNQEIHGNADWQNKMIDIEMRVSNIEEFRQIAFFHHLILTKKLL